MRNRNGLVHDLSRQMVAATGRSEGPRVTDRPEHRAREASALVLIATSFVLLIAMATLAIDLGYAYLEETHLQRGLNAAAVGAAEALHEVGTEAQARDAGTSFALANGITLVPEDVTVNPLGNDSRLVRVCRTRSVPLFFAPILGFVSMPTRYEVYAMANQTQTLLFSPPLEEESSSGIIPLGIPHAHLMGILDGSINTPTSLQSAIFTESDQRFSRGQRVLLKAGQNLRSRLVAISGQGASNQGALDLAGDLAGSAGYQAHFSDGYGGSIAIGDLLTTEPGTLAGSTQVANEYRFDQDPGASLAAGEGHVRPLSARMVVVPIVRAHADGPQDMETGIDGLRNLLYMHEGATYVLVIGFAKFLLDDHASTLGEGVVTGLFAEYVGTPPSGQDPG